MEWRLKIGRSDRKGEVGPLLFVRYLPATAASHHLGDGKSKGNEKSHFKRSHAGSKNTLFNLHGWEADKTVGKNATWDGANVSVNCGVQR